MTNQASDLLEAFNDAVQALNPSAARGSSMLEAVRKLVDELETFVGDNTGDQTITLSGDVSGTGTGAITTAIGAGKVLPTMLSSTALKLLVCTGVDASAEAAAATLTGAKVGDVVVGVVNLTDQADVSAVFEGVITVADEIQQASTNLATKKLLVLMIAKGA